MFNGIALNMKLDSIVHVHNTNGKTKQFIIILMPKPHADFVLLHLIIPCICRISITVRPIFCTQCYFLIILGINYSLK